MFCSGKPVTLVWHTATLQDLVESHRVCCVRFPGNARATRWKESAQRADHSYRAAAHLALPSHDVAITRQPGCRFCMLALRAESSICQCERDTRTERVPCLPPTWRPNAVWTRTANAYFFLHIKDILWLSYMFNLVYATVVFVQFIQLGENCLLAHRAHCHAAAFLGHNQKLHCLFLPCATKCKRCLHSRKDKLNRDWAHGSYHL